MADNPHVFAGTTGTEIAVAADEVTVFGGAAQVQLVKVTDGLEGGTTGAKVTSDGLYVFQANQGTTVGTVAVSNATLAVTQSTSPWVTSATVANQGTVVGTVTVANASLAVTQSTSPWVTAGTVTVSTIAAGTVTVGNGTGGAAVNIQDGGNSITIDGAVSVNTGTVVGTVSVTNYGTALKTYYGTEAQALSITVASLGSATGTARESTAVDNTTNLFQDVLVQSQTQMGTGTSALDKRVYVYAYATTDAATPLYPDTVTGSDAAITLNSPTNLRLLGIVECPAQFVTYKGGPWSLAQLYGSMPEKWGIVVRNETGIPFSGTAGNHKWIYQGVMGKQV